MKREIDKKIRFQNYYLEQVIREGDKAIYSQTNEEGSIVAYEVIIIKERKVGEFLTNSEKYNGFDTYEAYPSSEQFGHYGWSFSGKNMYQQALNMYNSI